MHCMVVLSWSPQQLLDTHVLMLSASDWYVPSLLKIHCSLVGTCLHMTNCLVGPSLRLRQFHLH